jgi:hypothetical protein
MSLTFAQAKVNHNALGNAFFYVGCSQTSCDSVSGNDVLRLRLCG